MNIIYIQFNCTTIRRGVRCPTIYLKTPVQFEMPDMSMNNVESTTLNTQTNSNVAAINNDIVIPNIHILDGDDDVKDTLGIVEAFA